MAKKIKVQKEVVNSMPVGVKILAILAYIGAAFAVLGGIVMMIGSAFLGSAISMVPGYAVFTAMGSMAFVVFGIIMIACGVLDYFIGKGLWNGRNWARILLLVFSVLGVLGSLWPLSIMGLVIDGIIIWYLGFNKEAIAYFK